MILKIEIKKEYYQNNRDRIKDYYLQNRDRMKDYYLQNRDRTKKYQLKNHDKIIAQKKYILIIDTKQISIFG